MIAVYARVSTEEQAKKGFSLQDQVKECRKKAQSNDVLEYIDEGISGEILDRPALTKLRNDVKEGLITKVVCLDPDRLSRKLMNQLIITDEFDKRGVDLVFVNGEYAKTPEGNLFYSMRGAIAEFEKSKINERMSRGRREKARQGKVLRDFKIYGYSYDKETAKIIINESEAEIVRLIFDLFLNPNGRVKGINGIANYLTDKRIPTKTGKSTWHRQVVRQILMNEAYTGVFYQNKWNTEGMLGNKHKPKEERVPMTMRPKEEWIKIDCPAIIDKAAFNYAQRILSQSRRRWAKESRHSYLLSGLLRCGDCGNTMTGRQHTNWGKKVFYYSDEKNTAGAQNRGCGRRVKVEDIDNEIWEKVRAWLDNPEEIAAAADQSNDKQNLTFEESEIARLEKEIDKAQTGRKRLLKLFAEGLDISESEIRESIKELKEKEESLIKQLEELKHLQDELSQSEFNVNILSKASQYYLEKGKDNMTFVDKRELIRKAIKEIRVYEDRIRIYTF
ncbi:recombinase family protein [Pullulanibacillus sp. KACC 23026]|uniref:recombinase family protein n=1 Tax=Pullulanibacillus sp. KACC 23026 TaxID=3028315 RepID=UPI0023B0627F|nr:recombinase family protein [Pullulanibacillus sp. KACC 23026]WEG14195.1 recombinase family protein [Pullulanibacillus sp. KACC 23026]